MKPAEEKLRELLKLLDVTEAEEIDCDEFLDRVVAYVENVKTEELPEARRALSQHAGVCPECREELEALLEYYSKTHAEKY